jgi:hypothetical protein
MIQYLAQVNAVSSIAGLRRLAVQWGAAAALLGLVFSPAAASALSVTFELEVEFDTGQTASYAEVTIEENAGNLDFSVVLSDALGSEADLHVLYFNLLGDFTGVAITTTDNPSRAYRLREDPSVRGGAGSSFDYGVNFGNGAGARNGNGILQAATFTLMADQPLAISDLLESSYAQGGSIEIDMAAHIQGTNTPPGSESVGGQIPEPSSASLVGLGLVALAALRRPARRSNS